MNKFFNTSFVYLDILLYLILLSKLCYIFLVIFQNFLVSKDILTSETVTKLTEFFHNTFFLFMPILLIILFNPITEKYMIIDHHIKLFLFAFGLLQLIDIIQVPSYLGSLHE